MLGNPFSKLLIVLGMALGIAMGCALSASPLSAEQLTVHFRSGTTLTGAIADQSIAWTNVAANGAVSQFNYDAGEIKSLFLSTSESSAQMIQVRRLLNQLDDADYHKRELAQQQLKSVGPQFRSIVESFVDHPSFEVRYRVKRLLSDKSFKTSASVKREFDRITLVDGTVWEGEATDFSLSLAAYGKTIALNRQNVMKISSDSIAAPEQNSAVGDPVTVELFHQHEKFNAPDQKEFRFDVRADGKEFAHRTKLDDYFKDDGLLFRHAERGFVGINSYDFKFDPLPVGGRSVGLFGVRRGSDLRGIMEITFCEPGNPMVSAGVYEFGTFIAKVSFRRDIILETYGAEGQLLATVEATDQKCVFAGVKSNQLITKVRVLSNPYLKKIERKIDDDYLIDTLRMSTPIATDVHHQKRRSQISLNNGDVIKSPMNFTKDGKIRVMASKVSDRMLEFLFPIDDLRSIHFGKAIQTSTTWQALLGDGSRVNLSPGKSFKSEQFGFSVSPKDLVGLWPAASAPRLPVAGDFSKGSSSPLIVFPTCRLRTKSVNFSSDRFSWVVDQKLQQPLQLGDKDSDEDPTPKQTAFKYADTLANQLPTVWMRPPKVSSVGGKHIYLVDGQRLALGDHSQFKLKGIGTRTITVTHRDGTPKDIPMSDVYSIQFGDLKIND